MSQYDRSRLTGLNSDVRIGPVGVAMVHSLSVMSTRQGDSRVGRAEEPDDGFTRSSSCGHRLLAPGSARLEEEEKEEELDLSIAGYVESIGPMTLSGCAKTVILARMRYI